MTYDEAVSYLDGAISYGIKPDLSRIELAVKLLENPQQAYPIIHVTGTNGKTTSCRLIKAILRAHGLKTGLYTSPHLLDVTERIEIDGPIAPQVFADRLREIVPVLEEVNSAGLGKMTYFEALTALAFHIFRKENVDCAVIEVGMGGRWDATNVGDGRIALITNVGTDHTDYLGPDIQCIAQEKSHIIKRGALAVTGAKNRIVLDIIKTRCRAMSASLVCLGEDFLASGNREDFDIKGIYAAYPNLKLAVRGDYQIDNAALAVAAAELFRQSSLDLTKLRSAYEKASSPGRLEVMSEQPLVVLDGAHNPDGAKALMAALPGEFDYKRLIVVTAILGDKDFDSILKSFAASADFLILTKNSSPRCLAPQALEDIARELGIGYMIEDDIRKAVKAVERLASPRDLILITGSLYTVADVRAMYLDS